jgi:hypothetical protein
MDLIREKEEDIGTELIEDAADDVADESDPNNVRWLSAKRSITSYERWLWVSVTIALSVLCAVLGVQLGKVAERPPAYKETDLGSYRPSKVLHGKGIR